MRFSNKIQYAPLFITILLVVYTIFETKTKTGISSITGEVFGYNVIEEVKYASIGLSIILGMTILKIRLWKHFFAIILLISTLGFIQFYSKTIGFNFGFLKIEFTGLFLLFLHFILNHDLVEDILNQLKIITEKNYINESQIDEQDISLYLKKYSTKTNEELIEISQADVFTPAAIEAAKRLIEKNKASV